MIDMPTDALARHMGDSIKGTTVPARPDGDPEPGLRAGRADRLTCIKANRR